MADPGPIGSRGRSRASRLVRCVSADSPDTMDGHVAGAGRLGGGGRASSSSNDVRFTVMPRDKVGLVGRNGAGKTSLVQGARRRGRAHRSARCSARAASATCPQDPRIAGDLDGRTAVTHVLSGRGIDEAIERIEKLRIAMEEEPSERNVARYSKAQDEFASSGGYSAESEARSIAAGLGLTADRLELPHRRARRAASVAASSCRASCSPAATCCCSTSRPTTSTSTPRSWLLDFMR